MRVKQRGACVLMALLVSISGPGCATTGRSIGAGAGLGALLGAGAGAITDPGRNGRNRIRNIVIGTAAGGILGAGAGFLADRVVGSQRQEAYETGRTEALRGTSEPDPSEEGKTPKLLPTRTEARWVPDQVRGQTYIPGHFEYVILEGPKWEMNR